MMEMEWSVKPEQVCRILIDEIKARFHGRNFRGSLVFRQLRPNLKVVRADY